MEKVFRICFSTLLPVLLGNILGCNNAEDGRLPTAKVTVTVNYKGKPVENAVVAFTSTSTGAAGKEAAPPPPAFGRTNEQGKAELMTYETGDGAVLGSHQVSIAKDEFTNQKVEASQDSADYAPAPGASPLPKVKSMLPPKYSLPGMSGLQAEVKSGNTNEFTFDLKD